MKIFTFKTAVLIVIGAVLFGTSGCYRRETQQKDTLVTVRAGHLVALDMAPLFVGKESGCFEKYGLDVETLFFANPGDNNAALAGGAIDFSTNPFTLPFFAANSGVPVRVISAAGGWGVMEIVGQGYLKVSSLSELQRYISANPQRKLKVGVLRGDTLELIVTRSFQKQGISLQDVQLVYFNDLLAMVEAFRAQSLDILSHIKPYTTDLVVHYGGVRLTTNAETWNVKTPNTVVSVLEKTLSQRPEIVEGYLRGLQCAAKIINSDPGQAIKLLQAGNYFRVDDEVVLKAFLSAPAPISFVPDISIVQGVISDLKELGYISGDTSADEIFRLETMRSIEAS